MKMIDEADLSQEGDDGSDDGHARALGQQKMVNLMLTQKSSMVDDNRSEGDHIMQMKPENDIVENLSGDDLAGNLSHADSEEWSIVRPRRRKHIELRDLTE